MKKVVSLVLALVMCLSLCGCGKSKEVKNVEEQISALSAASTYKEIHDAYEAYHSLDAELREQVENAGILDGYCNSNGYFVLTDAMLEEIGEDFKPGTLGIYNVDINVEVWGLYMAEVKGYKTARNANITRCGQLDAYTYAGYGTMDFISSSGAVSERKVKILYYAKYSEDSDRGYFIGNSVSLDGKIND